MKNEKKPDLSTVDRTLWQTPDELAREFGYTDYSTIHRIAKQNQITHMGDPKARPTPGGSPTFLYNRREFLRVPQIAERLISNEELETFDKPPRLYGNWMLTGDWHEPYHDSDLVMKLLAMAKKHKVRQGICVGDFLNLGVFSTFLNDKETEWEYDKAKAVQILNSLFGWFDRWLIVMGNHDIRLWKRLLGMGEENDVFDILKGQELAGKLEYTTYPQCVINDSWMMSHPKSYSRIQTRNSYTLASKYMISLVMEGKSPNGLYGFISYHGHQGGTGFDVSGRMETVDGMGMFDGNKVNYKQMNITTHPEWIPGFMMLRNNYLHRFPKHTTDWDFWLDGQDND